MYHLRIPSSLTVVKSIDNNRIYSSRYIYSNLERSK